MFLLLLITAVPKSFPVLQEKDSAVQKVIMASGHIVFITFFHCFPCKQSCQLLGLITRCTRFVSTSCGPSTAPTEHLLTAQCPAFSLPSGCVWCEARKQEGWPLEKGPLPGQQHSSERFPPAQDSRHGIPLSWPRLVLASRKGERSG